MKHENKSWLPAVKVATRKVATEKVITAIQRAAAELERSGLIVFAPEQGDIEHGQIDIQICNRDMRLVIIDCS